MPTLSAWIVASLAFLNAPPTWSSTIEIAATEAPINGDSQFTAALLLAIGYYEGGLRYDAPRSDVDQTCTCWQLRVGRARCAVLEKHPLDAAREARERIRTSFARCWELPREDRLAVYASGNCENGKRLARGRYRLARYLVTRTSRQ